ncbi:hypothetical protein BHM03_00035096 [Ensete ventricosum]|nr:hypothetical protein BHM03_00035096 [Ensete ventricosum]
MARDGWVPTLEPVGYREASYKEGDKEAAEDEDDDPAASISCWLDSEWVRRDPHRPLLLQEAAVHDPSCSNSPASLLFPLVNDNSCLHLLLTV